MQTLYATCGLAFSGKTTLTKRLAEVLGIPLVSLDDINSERGLCSVSSGSYWRGLLPERTFSICVDAEVPCVDQTIQRGQHH